MILFLKNPCNRIGLEAFFSCDLKSLWCLIKAKQMKNVSEIKWWTSKPNKLLCTKGKGGGTIQNFLQGWWF